MTDLYDAIILGSGPAGVSAAFPLLNRGLRVLMIDGDLGHSPTLPPAGYSDARSADPHQWRWMLGSDFHALKTRALSSPKFRVPALASVFSDFQRENRIHTDNFSAVGSLATGGLSNAWGCGVSRFSSQDLAAFPFAADDLLPSYERVTRRIGVSGRGNDDLRDFFGLDEWAQRPIALDEIHTGILARYQACIAKFRQLNIQMGRPRMAALADDFEGRLGCDLSSNCLWGCSRGALYNARFDLAALKKNSNLWHLDGTVADRLVKQGDAWTVHVHDRRSGTAFEVHGRTILLAAGCIASTRFVLDYLDLVGKPVRFFSNPTAAFLAWMPRALGTAQQDGFASSQLAMAFTSDQGEDTAYAGLFSTQGLPVSEFLDFLPLTKRYGIDVMRHFLASCVVGNVFFPGSLSEHRLTISEDRSLHVRGQFSPDLDTAFQTVSRSLRKAMLAVGGIVPPGACILSSPGTDVHYAGSLPMKACPEPGQTDAFGEVAGMPGVFAVDGASLPSLPAKSHTLTIMANADRIASHVATRKVVGY
ncbi:GMC oxidoreductase [Tardiphaga sp. 538_B7_N1_4]|uniref:GMC oxidoreductase n=1 Tax=Tardiphaga sp. 538_B7_N1_4 TaxID=3240778 RepID=UPI003F21EA06